MEIQTLAITEVRLLTPRVFHDDRGHFCETYNKSVLQNLGINIEFCQDNYSYSKSQGTVRGLHYQAPPFAQTKLVRVLRGSIVDVAVDARKSSPTFGEFYSSVCDEAP